jgi:hypothetical protein
MPEIMPQRWKAKINTALTPIAELFVNITELLKSVFVFLLIVCLLVFAVWWLIPDDWSVKYAAEYMVAPDKVVIDHKPYDCDWDSAPIGSKHCHYETIVVLYSQAGDVLKASEAANPAKVYVAWKKVED